MIDMKLIIAGKRDFYDYEKLKLILLEKYSLIITDDNTMNIKKVTRV